MGKTIIECDHNGVVLNYSSAGDELNWGVDRCRARKMDSSRQEKFIYLVITQRTSYRSNCTSWYAHEVAGATQPKLSRFWSILSQTVFLRDITLRQHLPCIWILKRHKTLGENGVGTTTHCFSLKTTHFGFSFC